MEASLRDWLFGCNIWGKSMIVDLPANNKSSQKPHSSLNILNGYLIINIILIEYLILIGMNLGMEIILKLQNI